MAWRGRGRGRGFGFGGQGFRPAKEDPFVLFPEDVVLPEHPHVRPNDPLITKKLALERFYRASVYHVKEKNGKSMLDSQDAEIERYSDRNKAAASSINSGSLSDFIRLNSTYLPPELFEGGSHMKPQAQKRLRRWDTNSDAQLFDRYEKLEGKYEGGEKKDEKAKKDGEEENEAVSEEEEVEESDDGDYNQNFDFDDDEDDLNMEDDDDGPVYDND